MCVFKSTNLAPCVRDVSHSVYVVFIVCRLSFLRTGGEVCCHCYHTITRHDQVNIRLLLAENFPWYTMGAFSFTGGGNEILTQIESVCLQVDSG